MFVLNKMDNTSFPQSEKISLLTKLPLIDFCLKSFPLVDFEKNLIISVQHLLTTTLSLFEALFEMGLNPSNLIVIGKCYSTDRRILDRLVDRGVFVAPASIAFDSHMAYDEQFDQIIDETLKIILNCYDLSKYDQITILDDGGHLIEKVHDLQIKHPRIVGIEQTSSGYNRTKHLPLSFPIINLAKAWAKTQYEPELILKHCLEEVDRFFEKIPEDSAILILGNGTLGNALYHLLKINHRIEVYDSHPARNKAKHKELIPLLEESNIIIGCTGNTSIRSDYHKYLHPSATLISVSSSDREFDAVHLRRLIPPQSDCHGNLNINGINLLNCGFPINFSDSYSSADSEDFQFTRSLILISLVQSLTISLEKVGYCDVEHLIQKKIVEEWVSMKSSF